MSGSATDPLLAYTQFSGSHRSRDNWYQALPLFSCNAEKLGVTWGQGYAALLSMKSKQTVTKECQPTTNYCQDIKQINYVTKVRYTIHKPSRVCHMDVLGNVVYLLCTHNSIAGKRLFQNEQLWFIKLHVLSHGYQHNWYTMYQHGSGHIPMT